MTHLLAIALAIATLCAWFSFVVLFRAAIIRPHIGNLTERTVIAFLLAVLGTVSSVIVANPEATWLDPLRLVGRLATLSLLLVSTFWLWLWYRRKLG